MKLTTKPEANRFDVETFNSRLNGLRSRDADKSRDFFNAYTPFIRNVIGRLQYMVRSADVEDLVQDTLIALLTSNDTCQRNVKGWLYKIAYMRLLSRNSRDYSQKRGGANVTVAYDDIGAIIAEEDSVATSQELRDTVRYVYRRVSNLDQRILHCISYGFTRMETADQLSISCRTIRRRLGKMRSALASAEDAA